MLNKRTDHVAIRAWRSETLMAVTASSEYESARRQRIHELAASLCGCIQVLLPKATKEQLVLLQKSLAQDLIIPAIKLSEKFHVSGKLFTQLGRGLDDERANITQELERYECRNLLENGRMVKTLQSGVDCEYVMDICPGLYCSSLKGDAISAPKRLKKTQILVAVTRPGRSHILHEETALGHIYKSVQEYKIAENKEIERKELEAKQKSSWFSGDRFF
jgi:hypothetical protein